MKITGARVIVTCPGRNFVTLKIETEDGLTGLGDATLNGRELAVAGYLTDQVTPMLIGRDAQAIEDIWQQLYRGAYWRRGPVTMAAIGAVDVALWDLKAKLAGLPLYQLLGGACRAGVMVYGHANGAGVDETVEAAARLQAVGYKAVRLQSGAPPAEPLWSAAKYLPSVPRLFEAARDALGWDIHLLHDVDHRLSPIEAGRLGRDLEPWRPFWLEDPTPAENLASFRLIRQHTTTPLAVGEVFNTIWDAKQLIEEQLIDYIRATVVHAGGVTHLRRIAALAELYGVRTGCHGSSDLSPVCMGAALHFDLSVTNFGIQEYVRHTAETDAVFPHAYRLAGGEMHPGEAAGHGVGLDEGLAARFPYRA